MIAVEGQAVFWDSMLGLDLTLEAFVESAAREARPWCES